MVCDDNSLWSWIKREFKLSNIIVMVSIFVMLVSFYNKSMEVASLAYQNSANITLLNNNKLDKFEFDRIMNVTNNRLEAIEAKIDKVIWEIRR